MHFAWQQYKRHVHQRCQEVRALISSEGFHFGASDLQVCWDDFTWQVQRFVWPGITFSWQAQYLRGGLKKSQNALVRGRQLCTQLSIFEGGLAEFFRFWCRQLRKIRKSRRIASFLMLSSSKIEEVSQNCWVFDVVKFKNWGRLAE